MPRLAPPQSVLGRYTVHALVGEGPLGEVHDIVDGQSGAHYALKLFPQALAGSPAWPPFLANVKRLAGSPGLARAFDGGIEPSSGTPYVLTELLAIPPLARHLVSDRLAPPAVGQLLKSLAAALVHAHELGVGHGALHPHNVFFQEHQGTAQVRVTDLGTAALRAAAPPPSGPARLGWIAPEQWGGAAPSPATDVWSMGVLAFYALTGRLPFVAAKGEPIDANALWSELQAALGSASQRARDLGVSLHESMDPWFARALSPNPAARFPSAIEAADAFVAVAPNVGLGGTFFLENAQSNAKLAAAQAAWAPTQAMPRFDEPPGAPVAAGAPPQPAPMMHGAGSQASAQAFVVGPPAGPLGAAPAWVPPSSPAAAPKKKSSLALILVPVALVLVGGIAAAAWFFFFRVADEPKAHHAEDQPSASSSAAASDAPAEPEPPAVASAEPPPAASSAPVAAKAPPVKVPVKYAPPKPPPKPPVGGGSPIKQKGK